MAQTVQELTKYRHRLDAAVTALSLFIRELCPEAQLDIAFRRYEEEDAHIWVSLPLTLTAEEREELANRMAEKSLDLLLAEGVLIMVVWKNCSMPAITCCRSGRTDSTPRPWGPRRTPM